MNTKLDDFDLRLSSHLLMMAPHQREREQGKLLHEAAIRIAALKRERGLPAQLYDEVERERDKYRRVLETIRDYGGKYDDESGLSMNGSWCAEQASTVLVPRNENAEASQRRE